MDYFIAYRYGSVFGLLTLCCLSLLGCGQPPASIVTHHDKSNTPAHRVSEEHEIRGHKLTEIAGHTTASPDSNLTQIVPSYAQPFIGRFYAQVQCDGGFVPCREGNAEFILNFLPDGTVHRSIIQYGKVFAEKSMVKDSNVNYRKDTWMVNPEKTELVVHRKEGLNLYYRIIDENHIVMNLAKILDEDNHQNQQLFSQGHPQPRHAYALTKNRAGQSME